MKQILIIDDEWKLCAMLKHRLELTGNYAVTVAYSGPEGLEAAKGTRFDVVITDFAMPGMTGEQVIDAMKALAPAVPVLLLSVYHDDQRIITPAILGKADGLIAKPIDSTRLLTTIEDVLARDRR